MALAFSPISGRTISGLPLVAAPPPPPSSPPPSTAQASSSMGGNSLRPDWSGRRYQKEKIPLPHRDSVDEWFLLTGDLIMSEEDQ